MTSWQVTRRTGCIKIIIIPAKLNPAREWQTWVMDRDWADWGLWSIYSTYKETVMLPCICEVCSNRQKFVTHSELQVNDFNQNGKINTPVCFRPGLWLATDGINMSDFHLFILVCVGVILKKSPKIKLNFAVWRNHLKNSWIHPWIWIGTKNVMGSCTHMDEK